MQNEKYYSIGAFSKVTGIPISSLRFYDKKNMLVPQKRDPDTNYRYYAEEQIHDAYCLLQLKYLDVPLPEIKQMLEHRDVVQMKAILQKRMDRYQDEIKRARVFYNSALQTYKQLGFSLQIWDELGYRREVPVHFEVRYMPEALVVGQWMEAQYIGDASYVAACVSLFQICEQEGLHLNGAFHMRYQNHTQERFAEGRYRALVFYPIQETASSHPAVQQAGGYWVLTGIHIGDYQGLAKFYRQLWSEAERQGLQICGEPCEEYLMNPFFVDDEASYITRVSFPILAPQESAE